MIMESSSSAIVVIQIPASHLELDFTKLSNRNLHEPTLKGIHNAWTESAGIDEYGAVWVNSTKLSTILRTSPDIARYHLDKSIKSEYKRKIDDKIYVKGTEICRLIDSVIQSAGSISREKYAVYSESMYQRIRDSKEAQLIRAEKYERIATYRSELRRTRIAKLSLTTDELTGDELGKRCQFSHIRSVGAYLELADKLWNGLVITNSTHKIITEHGVNDEEELLNLCYEKGWKTEWYNQFLMDLNE